MNKFAHFPFWRLVRSFIFEFNGGKLEENIKNVKTFQFEKGGKQIYYRSALANGLQKRLARVARVFIS